MGERNTILIVDDEQRFSETTGELLDPKTYDVISPDNGQTALDILSKRDVEVIILDLKIPFTGGEDVLDIVHKKHPDVPVIILTGHGTIDKAVACMKKGACDFLTKPCEMGHLLPAVDRAVEKGRLAKRERALHGELTTLLLALNTEKKRLKTIINCIGNGVMVTDNALQVVDHNPALMQLLEKPGEIKNPFPLTQVISDDALVDTLKRIQYGESPETKWTSQEMRVGAKYLRAISAPILGQDRKVFWTVVGAVTVIEDITPFKQLDQMKSDFVNMVVHELRSPLVAIRQLNSVLKEGLAGKLQEKQEDLVNKGIKKIDALLGLINDLLEMARMEAGKDVQQRIPTDIGQIVEEMIALMEPRARAQGVTLTHSCQNLKPIQADPKGIHQIFNNLISNAINYSPDGGVVTVSAQGLGEYIEIRVTDTGVGIPSEELPKIFYKFYRVKHPKTRGVTGTGLGLPIVKDVVEAHHGTIDVESVVNKGTTFRILLPFSA